VCERAVAKVGADLHTQHGGQETTLLALYNTVHHFGGVVVAPGYTDPVKFADGNPHGTSFVAG
jgi:NAD(P)H dehydrogenase (quinone)